MTNQANLPAAAIENDAPLQGEMLVEDLEIAVLIALADLDANHGDEFFFHLKPIATKAGLPVEYTRVALKRLTGMLLAEFKRGLLNDDGLAAGAGYGITALGRTAVELLKTHDLEG